MLYSFPTQPNPMLKRMSGLVVLVAAAPHLTGCTPAQVTPDAGGSAEATSAGDTPTSGVHRISFEDGATSTVWIVADRSELPPQCPASVYQFGADSGEDPEWTRQNRVLWDEAALAEVVEGALRQSRSALPGPPPDLCVALAAAPSDPVLERMGGIGGATMAQDLIALYLAPNLNPDILRDLPFTLAHEYHHAVTWTGWRTGLEILIREGKAHHFAWALYPDELHPSARALSEDEVLPAWARIEAALGLPPREFRDTYMFGGPYYGDVVPGWAGYTIGFCLVRGYAEAHPGMTPAALAGVPAREFVAVPPTCGAE